MLVPPLKRERTESSRGRLNIRVLITEFYLRSPGRFAGLFVAGSKSESPAAKRGFSAADSPVPQAGADKLPDPRCRAAKARHDGRRPIALPSSWPRCYPRNRAEPIVETHHLSRRYTRLVRHVAAPFDQAAAQNSLTERCRGRGGDIPYMVRGLTQKLAHCEIQIGPLGIALVSRTKSSWHFKPWLARQARTMRARSAKACAVLRRDASDINSARSTSSSPSGAKRRPMTNPPQNQESPLSSSRFGVRRTSDSGH
jgi:hypothetical protein